jgi:hypothetical protein
MKRLSAALVLGFLVSSFCFAQIQTGNASYNPSKTGLHINHSSLSFNTHVKVTNLRNNRSVEAVVDGRIPISEDRIADISRDLGDALEMSKSGMTLVQIEVLPPRGNTEVSVPAQSPVPAETPARETVPKPVPPPVIVIPAAPVTPAAPAPVQQDRPAAPPQILPVQTITDIQYVPVPASPSCVPYCLPVLLALLVLVIILLVVILVLLLRRRLLWPWHYPFWLRRYYHRYKKRKQRN